MLVAPAGTAADARNVLVLYSNGRLVPANVDVERGFKSSIVDSADRPVEIFSEFLDYPEFVGEDYENTVTTYLRNKFAKRPPDVVVAVARQSLDFLLRHRAQLFPGVPIVHAAAFRAYPNPFPTLPADVVGVPVEYDPAGTVEQALRWHPKARHLLVVTGTTPRDREWETLLREGLAHFEGRVTIEFLTGLPTDKLLARLRGLDEEWIVFTAGFYQVGDALKYTPRESVEMMAKSANAPVYGTFSSFVGTGAVGGRVPSFAATGQQAGSIVNSLLDGVSPASLNLPKVMLNELNVDMRQTRRWGIADKDIPAEAVVQFRQPTFWEAYRTVAIIGGTVILLQAGLIAALLLEHHRRRKAEMALVQRGGELAHASRLAIAGELTASIAHEINQPLAAILTNADAAEMILHSEVDRREDLQMILTDIRRDDLRASDVIRRLRTLLSNKAIERQSFDLTEIVSDACAILQAEARRREVTLVVRNAATPGCVFGDPVQIQQVLINLALNAMDAVAGLPGDRRTIVVSVEPEAGALALTVRDRGPGVAPEHLPKLFDSFFSTKRRGMGLGLSIARTIIEAHGGRIRVDSDPGHGTVFHVLLPVHGESTIPTTTLA
ncbi:ATP-binding protein [Variovorax sp. J31P207]|uniref:sensor histidine kinase n=1 Tax=Variovorax sp. J31P207 TaxID=3053510 RepID=UPI002575687D|nr:ATP-binding protein [Variovorax sp. J31P207]MDM0072143.1 ATP-binding protein [Variovorax sp. J31P207]